MDYLVDFQKKVEYNIYNTFILIFLAENCLC